MGPLNLDDIPAGSLCVVDTNVLLYAEQGISAQAQRLLHRCGTGELLVRLPQTVWHELCHKLMLGEALMAGHIAGGNPAAKLARKPEAVRTKADVLATADAAFSEINELRVAMPTDIRS